MPLTVGGGVRKHRRYPPAPAGRRRQGLDQFGRRDATAEFVSEAAREIRQPVHRRGHRCQGIAPAALEIFTHGGRNTTGIEAVELCKGRGRRWAPAKFLLTSMDRDGTGKGFDLALTRAISDAVPVPVIASGGVGTLDHLVEGIRDGHATAVLAASIFHFGDLHIARGETTICAAPACMCARRSDGRPMSRFTLDDLAADHRRPRRLDGRAVLHEIAPDAGPGRAAKKFGEEAVEAVVAAMEEDRTALVEEAADVLYHLIVLLRRGISPWTR